MCVCVCVGGGGGLCVHVATTALVLIFNNNIKKRMGVELNNTSVFLYRPG